MQTDAEVAAIAAGLTKASRRALVRIGAGWTEEGGSGPARKDAYSLWWGRDFKHRLVEQPRAYAFGQFCCSWKWKLTPLGHRVAQHLKQENAKCRIGSCQRHGKCMYAPCRNATKENAK